MTQHVYCFFFSIFCVWFTFEGHTYTHITLITLVWSILLFFYFIFLNWLDWKILKTSHIQLIKQLCSRMHMKCVEISIVFQLIDVYVWNCEIQIYIKKTELIQLIFHVFYFLDIFIYFFHFMLFFMLKIELIWLNFLNWFWVHQKAALQLFGDEFNWCRIFV